MSPDPVGRRANALTLGAVAAELLIVVLAVLGGLAMQQHQWRVMHVVGFGYFGAAVLALWAAWDIWRTR